MMEIIAAFILGLATGVWAAYQLRPIKAGRSGDQSCDICRETAAAEIRRQIPCLGADGCEYYRPVHPLPESRKQ
ncbi:hypothetical protein [Candidatus Ferrigenium straubiae]|uniref:hypothetical protein n=1 Tax=Candidatus Ferrigenium straubiae TaxID=2919506 RepID=UPI003F4A8712